MVHVAVHGRTWRFQAVQHRPGGDPAAAEQDDPFAASPMTGTVRKVLVRPGDKVASGGTLFVVEAMKMEFAVTAPRDVVVDEVRAAEGARVDIQQVVVTFRAAAAPDAPPEAKP
jgi:biotin carboxyl carrier protein